MDKIGEDIFEEAVSANIINLASVRSSIFPAMQNYDILVRNLPIFMQQNNKKVLYEFFRQLSRFCNSVEG